MQRIAKTFVLLFVILLTFSLIGCGSTGEDKANAGKKEEKASEIVKKEDKIEDKQEGHEETTNSTASLTPETESKPEVEVEKPAKNAVEESPSSSSEKPVTTPITPPETTGKTPVTQPSTPPSDPPTTKPENPKPVATVTFSIVGPKDRGTILAPTKISFKDGDTAFDVLKNATEQHNIQRETRGSGATAYVEGIDNFYEFDYGAKSGWVFELNSVSISKSIGTIKVKDGDRIECYYTE
ncbi:MAG: hypothetical protein K0Q87_2282 [Neobacillus sp.]|jgi:hypothetical protein|nr:hypothetical protein [Neobacillus sp.]